MRSVSIHIPPNIREANGKPPGPKSSNAGTPPRKDTVGIGVVLSTFTASEGGSPIIAVQHVWPGSPAEAGGLKRNDVILSIDGGPDSVASAEAAKQCIQGTEGSAVSLQVRREAEVVDIGPIERGSWVTMTQIDQNLERMRSLLADNRQSGLSEVCTNLTRLRHTLTEERKAFQEEVAIAGKAAQKASVLESHLVDMAEEVSNIAESAAVLGGQGGVDVATKQVATAWQFSELSEELVRSVHAVIAKLQDAAGPEHAAAASAELGQVQAQVESLSQLHSVASKEAVASAEPVAELHRMASAFFPNLPRRPDPAKPAVADLIAGWRKCVPRRASDPFWYSPLSRHVTLTEPPPEPAAARHGAGGSRRRGGDVVVCGGETLAARRASFGAASDVSGAAVRATPYLADSKLDNARRVRGQIAVIGRGKCSFVAKAKRAMVAGAVGVVIVNGDDRACEVVGESSAVTVPVVSVGRRAALAIRDGDHISILFSPHTTASVSASVSASRSRVSDSPSLPPMVDRPRPPLQLSPHPEGPVVASSSPQPALVEPQPGRAAGKRAVGSRQLNASLGSASLCSQGSTVVIQPALADKLPSRRPPAPPPDSASTPRSIRPLPETVVAVRAVGKEEGGGRVGVLSPRGRGGEEGAWTGSEWSIKSQGSGRGRAGRVKVRLYRLAVEAVGVVRLPAGWDMRMSRRYHQVFFFNRQSGERRWSRPPVPLDDNLNRPAGALAAAGQVGPVAAGEGSVGGEEGPGLLRTGSGGWWSPEGREEEGESVSRASSAVGGALLSLSPPVGAVVSHGVVIPPWPGELRAAMGSMARILLGGRQIVATRAEFGAQAAGAARSKGVVAGRIERAQPWLANGELLNGDQLRGAIAVIGRGGCPFTDKARAVEAAGALAAVIVNHADFLFNVLGEAPEVAIPVVSVTKADGEALQSGVLAAVQWGEAAPDMIEEDPEGEAEAIAAAWSFKMTSKVVKHASVADDEEHPPSVC